MFALELLLQPGDLREDARRLDVLRGSLVMRWRAGRVLGRVRGGCGLHEGGEGG